MKKSFLSLAILSIALAFTACKKDDENNNKGKKGTMTFNGEKKTVTNALLFYYGEWEGEHEWDLILTSGISIEIVDGEIVASGSGDVINLEMASTGETLPTASNYPVNFDTTSMGNYIWGGFYTVNLTLPNEEFDEEYDIKSGSLDLSHPKNGEIKATGTFVFEDWSGDNPDANASIDYTGSVMVFDESDFLVERTKEEARRQNPFRKALLNQ
ncbi:MAG: hypothetical protein JJU02_06200 [Cryomorphaceae bacterium]|nr:hypothetical protein [Cryomorphaceae bacterium]